MVEYKLSVFVDGEFVIKVTALTQESLIEQLSKVDKAIENETS